jgi:hypothetical protein
MPRGDFLDPEQGRGDRRFRVRPIRQKFGDRPNRSLPDHAEHSWEFFGRRFVVLGRSEECQQRHDRLFGAHLPQGTPGMHGRPHLAAGRLRLVQSGVTGHANQVTDMLTLKSEPRTVIRPVGRIVAASLANAQ